MLQSKKRVVTENGNQEKFIQATSGMAIWDNALAATLPGPPALTHPSLMEFDGKMSAPIHGALHCIMLQKIKGKKHRYENVSLHTSHSSLR